MFDVICVGSTTLDTFLTIHQKLSSVTYGSKILIKHLETHTGGGGSNSAAALAKLGLKVGYLGKLSKEDNSKLIRQEFHQNKIKILNQKRSFLPTDQAFILNSEQEKDRVIYIYKGASDDLTVNDLPKKLETKWFYLATLLGKSFPVLTYLAKYAQKNKIKTLFNPSTYLASQGLKKLKPILENTSILILNKGEASFLLKTKNNQTIFLLKVLKKIIKEIVIITDGPKKVMVFDGKTLYSAQPPKVKVIHTAGCGDAFNSGFLAGLIKTGKIESALSFGLANASSVAQHLGTKNKLLTERETEFFIKKHKIKVIKEKFE